MSNSRALAFLSITLCAISVTACGPTYSKTIHEQMGSINKQFLAVEKVSLLETRDPNQAIARYQEVLAEESTFNQPFAFYQSALRDDLERIQKNPASAVLTKDSINGFPVIYDRKLQSFVSAHEGLARIHLSRNEFDNAEREALRAITLTKERAINPIMLSTNLSQSYTILHRAYSAQGRTGQALLAKLNTDLLNDYLESRGALQEFYSQKRFLEGEKSSQQIRAIASLVDGANEHRLNKHLAELHAMGAALDQFDVALHTAGAQYLLAKSGGVMTPEVQRMQARAQLARFQANMNMRLAEVSARQGHNLQASATPWVIPTFSQQLVDPNQGANTPTIMKGFVSDAAEAGGAPYQAGAQQVTQAIDAFTPYRESDKLDGAVAQVEKFTGVFNAFLTQVQEIKK